MAILEDMGSLGKETKELVVELEALRAQAAREAAEAARAGEQPKGPLKGGPHKSQALLSMFFHKEDSTIETRIRNDLRRRQRQR